MKNSGINNNLFALFAIILSIALFFSGLTQAAQYEAPHKTAYRYSVIGLQLGVIQPDADNDNRNFIAQRFIYGDPSRPSLVTQIESGNLIYWQDDNIAPAQWTNFTVFTTRGFEYDNYGRKIKEWIKSANGTIEMLSQYTYNTKGLVQCKARRMNKAAYGSLPSDACLQSTLGTEGPDRITRYTYNDLDQVLTEERAVGTSLAQTYVTNTYQDFLLKTQTDANGNKTELKYDEIGRLTHRYYPSPTAIGTVSTTDYNQYGYDANNNITMERKRNGAVINFQYDKNNRMILKDYVDNTQTADIYYNYDLRGITLHSRFGSDSGEGIINKPNGFGNIVQSDSTMGGVTRTLRYTFDLHGNRTRITHPDSVYFGYSFDGINRVNGATENASNLITLTYRPDGKRNTLARAGSGTTIYTFDDLSRLGSLQQDFLGTANDVTNSFTYNPVSQVTSLTISNSQFRYQGNNNRLGTYTPNGLNQYTTIGGQPIAYDTNGNLTNDGSTIYAYDMENRLVSTSGSAASSFKYDPLGRLHEVTVAGNTTRFLYDGDALVAEYNSAGALTRRYLHGDQVDEPWVQYYGPNLNYERRFLYADHQGSIIAHSNYMGTLSNALTYDAYGIPGTANLDRFGYTGQIWFKELGLFHYKARMYHPKLGRFLQTDPIFYADQMNMYAYVGNDPVNVIDPSGMSREYFDEPDDFDPTTDDLGCGCQGTSMSNSDGSDDNSGNTSGENLPTFEQEPAEPISDTLPDSPASNTNPYDGPVDEPVIAVDKNGNAIPVQKGEQIKSSPNGDYQQVRGPNGPNGVRLDRGGHRGQKDPRANEPHAHQPGATTPDGNHHLPIY